MTAYFSSVLSHVCVDVCLCTRVCSFCVMYAGVLVLRSARACARVHITGGGVV